MASRLKGFLMAGRLLYLMGPSGAGKDTILDGLAHRIGSKLHIAPRIVTRPCTPTERRSISVAPARFQQMQRQGRFAMAWHANGLSYGISRDIHEWLASGCDVVVNGSRAYLRQASQDFPCLLPILLHVDTLTLEQRLTQRRRETGPQIEARMARNTSFQQLSAQHTGNPIINIDNSGPVELAIGALCLALEAPLNTTQVQILLQENA